MFAGLGAQTGGLNRWGDYTLMSVDPRDGCSFWYVNQYQPANGLFNWKTRIGSFRFPTCAAPLRGTITGLVTDALGNPIANAVVQVDAGFSGATDETGRYIIVLPPRPLQRDGHRPARGLHAVVFLPGDGHGWRDDHAELHLDGNRQPRGQELYPRPTARGTITASSTGMSASS